jgi:SNF2 family DNA or RNA helicase
VCAQAERTVQTRRHRHTDGEQPHGAAELLELFRRRIKPLVKRRTKDLVAPELPAKQEHILDIELTPRHRKLYDTRL